MSLAWISSVWKLADVTSTQKLVLLALADNANDDGSCFPSVPLLARKTCLSDRAVRGTMRDLETAGLVRSEARRGMSTMYRLMVSPWVEVPSSTPTPRNVVPPTPEAGAALCSVDTPERSSAHPGTSFRPPRNNVPPTPERGSGDPGTSFRLTVNEPSINHQVTVSQPSRAGEADSDDDIAPNDVGPWLAWWSDRYGVSVDPRSVGQRTRFMPLAKEWIEKRITFRQMAAAIDKARRDAKEPIANLPAYAWTVLQSSQQPERSKRQSKSQLNAATAAALAAPSVLPSQPAREVIDVVAHEIR